jgi:hypothetical protein
MKALRYIGVILLFLFISGCSSHEPVKGVFLELQDPVIRQRYGGEMGALVDELKQAGITLVISPALENGTAFFPSDILPQRWEYGTQLLAFRHELRRRNIHFAAAVPLFYDEYTFRAQPALRAVNDFGAVVESAICPANSEYLDYKLAVIAEIMLILQPDALYLDKACFPLEEMQYCNSATRIHARLTCFCNTCIKHFSSYAGIAISGNMSTAENAKTILNNYLPEWTRWRSSLITSNIERIRREMEQLDPECHLMLSTITLREQDSGDNREMILGMDYHTLHPFVNTFVLNPCSKADSLLTSDIQQLRAAGEQALPMLEVRHYLRYGEDVFRDDLQSFSGNLIISDWSQLLNNRRYLNIFTLEL